MDSIDRKEFMHLLWRYRRGSVSRRHFLGASGLGIATAVMAQAMPWLAPKRAHAAANIGDRVAIATHQGGDPRVELSLLLQELDRASRHG